MHTHTLWAARVAAGTVLPDKRLPARLACILETFAERPSDAIPQAAGSWGQAKGIYRFLANPRVQPAALQQGLTSDTARQCLAQPTVLVVQDTTSLNLTGCHVLPELGPIGSGNLAQGVLLHSTLALTEQGAVLGVLGLQTWARPAGNAPGPEAKESGKWLHGIDQARQVVWETAWAAGAAAPPRLIHLMDREGDVYEVLQWVEEVGDSAIIRCVQNRRVEDPLRLGPCCGAGPAGAGPRHAHRAAVARQARPDRDGGDAGVDHDVASGSQEIPPRLAADVDAGGGVGAAPGAGMRGPALVVVDAGARYDAGGGAGGGAEIHLPLADRGVSLDAEERLSHRGLTAGKVGQFGKGNRDVHQRGRTDCGVAGPGAAGAGRASHGVAE